MDEVILTATTRRILLVEHLDAVGSSLTDLRPRAALLRNLGFDVRMAAIAAEGEGDLQHGIAERRQSGIEHYDEASGIELVRRAMETWNVDAVVWASSAPGGGEVARELGKDRPAWWWPSGWSTSRTSGPLSRLAPELGPGDACVLDAERPKSARLSLWDGPYALVASPLKPADAEHLFDGFARAADQRDEIDLVLLDHPDPELESLARTAGISQRVHFVGPAPREAEHAWLQHARVTFVTLQRSLAAGLVLRTLAAGCPIMAVGQAAEPVRAWLGSQGLTWGKPERSRLAWDTVAEALARTPAVETAIARGRTCAADCAGGSLAARIGPLLGGREGRRDRAA
jgi:glycosyltransferase involved in cell wall biosynthesis